jgi:hypothetical protein
MAELILIFRYTRRWIHYGLFAHTVICAVVAAVEGVMGK